jgi:GNAT superfamily N-acetyltransferase
VVLRRRLGVHEGREQYADVLGELVGTDDPIRIRRENGEIVEVPRAEIHRMKPIPPRPTRLIEPLELEEIAAAGWPAAETEWLGRWLLRAAEGWTGRANSVLPLGDPGLHVDQAIGRVREWYAARRLPARFQVPSPGADEVDAALEAAGFTAYSPTLVQTASLAAFSAQPRVEVALDATPSPEWLAAYHYRGGDSLPPVALPILTGAKLPVFASVVEAGQTVAVARAVVDSDWLGVTAVDVAPTHRRRGLATDVMRALATWGARNGARQSYLQVAAENEPAQALYERLGFRTHHRYHYRMDAARPDTAGEQVR